MRPSADLNRDIPPDERPVVAPLSEPSRIMQLTVQRPDDWCLVNDGTQLNLAMHELGIRHVTFSFDPERHVQTLSLRAPASVLRRMSQEIRRVITALDIRILEN